MIDAHTVGITLALDNGVSEGLKAIRRDFIGLNGVVEDSGASLKLLTRAAAGLQVHPGVAHSNNIGSTAPVRGHSDGTNFVPSDSSSLDPSVFAPNRSSPSAPVNAMLSLLFLSTFKSTADVGMNPATHLGIVSGKNHPSVPDLPNTKPVVDREWNHGIVNAEFAPAQFPLQMPLFGPALSILADRSADRHPLGSAVLPLPLDTNRISGRPLTEQLAIAVSQASEGLSPQPAQRRSVGAQMDHPQTARTAPHDMTAWHPPSIDPLLPSATPPPVLSPSNVAQGDVYVDGSRLGRWVTSHLAKAAELPRAATTGFDPRMTPTWPGAPVSA